MTPLNVVPVLVLQQLINEMREALQLSNVSQACRHPLHCRPRVLPAPGVPVKVRGDAPLPLVDVITLWAELFVGHDAQSCLHSYLGKHWNLHGMLFPHSHGLIALIALDDGELGSIFEPSGCLLETAEFAFYCLACCRAAALTPKKTWIPRTMVSLEFS